MNAVKNLYKKLSSEVRKLWDKLSDFSLTIDSSGGIQKLFEDREIVVTCHAGIRSYNFCQWSLDNNIVSEIWNLEEGIDGWSRYIDPSIPRY